MFDAPAGSKTRSTNAAAAHPAHAIYQSILTTDTPLVTTDTPLSALNWLRMGRLVASLAGSVGWSRAQAAALVLPDQFGLRHQVIAHQDRPRRRLGLRAP